MAKISDFLKRFKHKKFPIKDADGLFARTDFGLSNCLVQFVANFNITIMVYPGTMINLHIQKKINSQTNFKLYIEVSNCQDQWYHQ